MKCDYCEEETNFLVSVANPPRNGICIFCLKQLLERIDTSKRPEYPITEAEKKRKPAAEELEL